MMRCCSSGGAIQEFLNDYEKLQRVAVILIYIQIGCALVGSLGALYNGVLLINLAVALFALVAIESSSQNLGRTYAILLSSAITLDVFWFILFFSELWKISFNDHGIFFIFSLKLTLSMQILGFSVRVTSSLIWIQMYRLGVSSVEGGISPGENFDIRNSFLNSNSFDGGRRPSDTYEPVGGSIYDPVYYSSLFESVQHKQGEEEGDVH